jgi:hypothetical protein
MVSDFWHTQLPVDRQAILDGAGDVDLNTQVGWRIFVEINLVLASHERFRLDIEPIIGFDAARQLDFLQVRSEELGCVDLCLDFRTPHSALRTPH